MKTKVQILMTALSMAAVVMFMAAPAYAIDFSISGQVNRAAMYADDSESAKWFFVDNDNSSTRFRFKGSNEFANGWKAGFLWENEMQSNASNKVSMSDDEDLGDITIDERHMDVWIEKWGTLRLGQGHTASDGTSEVDLSGTDVAHYSDINAVGGNFEFRDGDKKLGITVSDSRDNFDGWSRKDRVRYDTPTWAGFYGSGSVGNNSRWDVAARYAGDFGWAKLAAAAAWGDPGTSSSSKDGDVDGQFSSSASILFNFGLNITASYAIQDTNDDDPWNLYGKIGYQFLEKHAASVHYSRTTNLSADDDEADSFSVAYVFNPWKSVELFGTYYIHMLDRDRGTTPDDLHFFMAGSRIKF